MRLESGAITCKWADARNDVGAKSDTGFALGTAAWLTAWTARARRPTGGPRPRRGAIRRFPGAVGHADSPLASANCGMSFHLRVLLGQRLGALVVAPLSAAEGEPFTFHAPVCDGGEVAEVGNRSPCAGQCLLSPDLPIPEHHCSKSPTLARFSAAYNVPMSWVPQAKLRNL